MNNITKTITTSGCALNISEEDTDIKILHEYYTRIPCITEDCIYFAGDYEERHEYLQGYSKITGQYASEPFIVIWHGQKCMRNPELASLRKEIYDRAIAASDDVHKEKKYKNISTEIHKAGEAFDKIADEWREMKCSFYQTSK